VRCGSNGQCPGFPTAHAALRSVLHVPSPITWDAKGCGTAGCGWYTARGAMSGIDRLAL